ncbi:MAG TPA: hypothetical protein GXZ87_07695 [Bacteroidales bacterium]|nr:hypothetical protein [Bacteroidales bacterium]
MAKKDLGKIAITPRGEWVQGTEYERLDVVKANGGSYLSLVDNNSAELADETAWMVLAERGLQGGKMEYSDLTDEDKDDLVSHTEKPLINENPIELPFRVGTRNGEIGQLKCQAIRIGSQYNGVSDTYKFERSVHIITVIGVQFDLTEEIPFKLINPSDVIIENDENYNTQIRLVKYVSTYLIVFYVETGDFLLSC